MIERISYLSDQLFALDIVLQTIFINFNQKYSNFKVIRINEFEHLMPMTLNDFKANLLEQTKSSITYLQDNWLKECVDLIEQNQAHIEVLTPKKDETKRMDLLDKYFQTVALLISLLLRRIFHNTLNELKEFFSSYKTSNSKKLIPFVCLLNCDADSLKFDPLPKLAYQAINHVIDRIILSFQKFPRVELFLFEDVNNLNLKYPNLIDSSEDSIVEIKNSIKEILEFNLENPIK